MTNQPIVWRADRHKRMLWKNGGGSTTEIAVHPDGADLGEFDWRISMASVECSGPFSIFPGIDRTLFVLDGEGLVLHGLWDRPMFLGETSPPLTFSADRTVECTLVAGPVTDLNVMTRRGRFSHDARRIGLDRNSEATLPTPAAATAIVLARRPIAIAIDGQVHHLERGDAMQLGSSRSAIAKTDAEASVFYLIRLLPEGA